MMDQLLCDRQNSLLDALQVINKNGKRMVFVVDEHRRLTGVLTDGDIRRLLLAGHHLREQVDGLVQKDFVFARQGENYKSLLSKITDAVTILPVVNGKMEVVDYFEYSKNIHIPVAHPNLKGREFNYLVDAFLSTWISSRGMYIDMFEKGFSQFCGTRHGVSASNGTVALHLALLAAGIGKGDEVILPDLTFAATINAVLYVQAKPVIVDVDKERWCMDPAAFQKAVTRKTKAVIPVHLYGQPCDMDGIMAIAKKHRLKVIEDCAQAHGATFGGKRVGSFGDIGCFSFFGNKIITTGEGGMCLTQSGQLNQRLRLLRDHGMDQKKKYWHTVVGYNYRMTNLQAAIGVAQVERVDEILRERQQIEDDYRKALKAIPFVQFQRANFDKTQKVVWLVSVLLTDGQRDLHMRRLQAKGIEIRPFFYPLSSMALYRKYAAAPCVHSRRLAKMGINFPTGAGKDRTKMFQDIKRVLHAK